MTEQNPIELHCECGGDMRLDYFNPITRPVEWFLRCRLCGKTTESQPTPQAVAVSVEQQLGSA